MSKYKNVVWYEGMSLDPHHFQQRDRYQRAVLDFRIRSISHLDWGLSDLAIDKEALSNGQFRLIRCKGVTPDGVIFNIPEDDSPQPAQSIQDFPPTEKNIGAYLVIPLEREKGSNCSLEDSEDRKNCRYIMDQATFSDYNTGTNERQIGIARTNLQIVIGTEPLIGFSVLKLAEITRSSVGAWSLHANFIPSCLVIDASERLISITRKLVELLIAKSLSLGEMKQPLNKIDPSSQDIMIYSILKILNNYISVFNHYFTVLKVHPEQLYINLLTLASQLSVFSQDENFHPRHFPTYDHKNLSNCFNALNEKIMALLDSIIPSARYTVIPLKMRSESLYIGRIDDPKILSDLKLILKVTGEDVTKTETIEDISQNIRVASQDTIDSILSSFSKALSIKHIKDIPKNIPQQESALYFSLEKGGPFWEAICRSNSLAIFLPKEFKKLKIEVLAVE